MTEPSLRHHCRTRGLASLTLVAALSAACTTLPQAHALLVWQDGFGGRDASAAQRDLADCLDVVESRRGLVEGCMATRGWRPPSP